MSTNGTKGQRSAALVAAIHGAGPGASAENRNIAARGVTPLAAPQRGLLARLFEDPEERTHRRVLKTIEHVYEETDLATTAVTRLAEDTFAAMLDTEAQFEQTITEYADSTMAMEAAPTYCQFSRQLLVEGVRAIATGGRDRVLRELQRR